MAEFSLGTAALGTAIDLSGLRSGQEKAHKETEGWLSGLQGTATKGLGGLQKAVSGGLLGGLGIVTAGFAGLIAAFGESEAQARESINAEKQLNAVLESTGGAAGMSAQELKDLASSLQKVTNFGDDATIQGESLLLTFTGIGRDVFPRATETMLDMSQALGQDMKSSAIQLGKALNDPITGVSALSRVGVSFTEQQKEQIKTLAESGDLLGAQTIILDELAKEFGGSARAMADPTIQMSNAFGDLKEVIGGVIVRMKNDLAEKALPIINEAIGKATELITGIIEKGWGLSEVLGFISEALGLGAEKGIALGNMITEMIAQVIAIKDAIVAFLAPIVEVIGQFVGWKDILIALGIVVASIVLPMLWGIVAAAAPIIAIAAALVGAVALVRQAWENDWGGIRTAITSWWEETGRPIFEQVRIWLAENLPEALSILRKWWEDKLLPALRTVWEFLKTYIIPLIGSLINVWFAALRVEIALVQAAWENILLPALRIVWAFVRDYIIPIFDGMSNSIGSVVGVIQGVIDWLGHLAEKFNNLADNIPAWLIPGSPTSFEVGLRGVADAMRQTSRAGELMGDSLAMRGLVGVAAGGASATISQNFYGEASPALVGRSSRQGVLEAMRRAGRA